MYRSLSLVKNLNAPLFSGSDEDSLGMLFLGNANKGGKALREVKSMYQSLARKRNTPEKNRHLHYLEYETKKQTKVVDNNGKHIPLTDVIRAFIEIESNRYVDSNPWQDRSR